MTDTGKITILCVDDDIDMLKLMERFLTSGGHRVITADSGPKAVDIAGKIIPDLIFLDVVMPEMNGYQVCSDLQQNHKTSAVPIIFVTAMEDDQNKALAFSSGAVDYLVKPPRKETLLHKVKTHATTKTRWQKLDGGTQSHRKNLHCPDFLRFKEFLSSRLALSQQKYDLLRTILYFQLYSLCSEFLVTSGQMAKLVAEFSELTHLTFVDPEDICLGVLPVSFCRKNHVVALKDPDTSYSILLSNPFDSDLLDILEKNVGSDEQPKLVITEPNNIMSLIRANPTAAGIAEHLLNFSVSERASDIHLEPKADHSVFRIRIDGDLKEVCTLRKNTSTKIISRFKALGGLDIADKRRPQDGSLTRKIDKGTFKLRLATSSTPCGESIVIRILEPSVKSKSLEDLGMSPRQVDVLLKLFNKNRALVLIVGPSGSGKTTTIYSLLSYIDCKKNSLMSVEDPVEYDIPFANQQQVDEKAGSTFESVLKSSVRQDPDILFIGEIRDSHSAKIAIDFASTGHISFTTMHTSNATTAAFRLERLGVDRGVAADCGLFVVAQRLLKKLCPHCKRIVPISNEEMNMLLPFTEEIPRKVAHPAGCVRCNDTGYIEREGIYEIIEYTPELSEMVMARKSSFEIRSWLKKRYDHLISDHAVQKVKDLIFSPRQAYENVLMEDVGLDRKETNSSHRVVEDQVDTKDDSIEILLVEDDRDTQKLIAHILENRGCSVTIAEDGISAIAYFDKRDFDLIISDINMPDLDGFELLRTRNQNGIETPVIFLTSRTSDEDQKKGLELGASDYIKKPVNKDVLMQRVKRVIEKNK